MNVYEIIIRLLLSVLVGGVIGYEREHNNRPAGFRTHILVCVGACVISMIQLYDLEKTIELITKYKELSGVLKADIGRIGAQVVSGIGFLGAGTIIHEKGSIKGLTTAASLWVVACIGLAVGLGYYSLSVLSTIAVSMVLVTLKKFESKFLSKKSIVKIEISYMDKQNMIQNIHNYFQVKNVKIKNIEFLLEEESEVYADTFKRSLYTIVVPRYIRVEALITHIASIKEVIKVTII